MYIVCSDVLVELLNVMFMMCKGGSWSAVSVKSEDLSHCFWGKLARHKRSCDTNKRLYLFLGTNL